MRIPILLTYGFSDTSSRDALVRDPGADELRSVPTYVLSESSWASRSRRMLLVDKLSRLDWVASAIGEENCCGVELHAGGEVAR